MVGLFFWGRVQLDTFKKPGGQAAYRTMETEKHDTLYMRRMFESAVTLKSENSGGGRAATKSKNPYGRTLTIPF